ncbi:acetyl-CoA acetyltransferase [Bartonella sp. LJL80]
MTKYNIPVIVGVGQVNDRPATPEHGLDSLGLMIEALKRAEQDAGGNWLNALDWLATIEQISYPDLGDVLEPICNHFGAKPQFSKTSPSPCGHFPVRYLNEAANAIAEGHVKIAAVTGGEALRTAAALAKEKLGIAHRDVFAEFHAQKKPSYAERYHLSTPTDVYPLYENAARKLWKQTFAQAQQESGQIWSLFSEIADKNPNAWLHSPMTPEQIVIPSPQNRPITFPYQKYMVANSSVNQGAAFIVTSLEEAERRGIARERLVFIGYGAGANEPEDILNRDQYGRSASMHISMQKAIELNQLKHEDIRAVELYSCFPCVTKMARRTINWSANRPATVVGGLTFGGAAVGNYMSHAIAQMTALLRDSGDVGLLFGNGGFATYNHTIVLSGKPFKNLELPKNIDFQADADAMRGKAPSINEGHVGSAEIETYTAFYDRAGQVTSATIIAKTPKGERTLAEIDGAATTEIARLLNPQQEMIGKAGTIKFVNDRQKWQF